MRIKNSLINEFLVVLMALILILSQTIFHATQVLLELALILTLSVLLLKQRLSIWEICLLLFMLFSQLVSIIIYDMSFNSFMLNTKVTGLAILSLIYFRRNATVSVLMTVFFIVCLSLVLIQFFITSKFPVNIDPNIIKNLTIFNNNQPKGLFLDHHTTSYFLAIFFIGITLTRKLFFIDLFVIWLIGVRTNFLALIGQKALTIAGKRFYILKKASVQITIVVVGISLLLTVFLPLFFGFLDATKLLSGDSARIMAKSIINPNQYLDSLYFFPVDYFQHHTNFLYDVGFGEYRSSELALVAIMLMFGTPMALIFLYQMLKFAPYFRVFLLLSTLHYSNILNPLMIYLVFMFENKLIQLKENS